MLGTRGSGLDAVWEKISLGRATDGGGSVLGRPYLISSLLLRFSTLRRRLFLRLLHEWWNGYYFCGLLAAGEAAHLSELEINLALCHVQVGEGTLYAINGKRDLMKLNACTSLQHTLSYGGDEDLTFMISLGHD